MGEYANVREKEMEPNEIRRWRCNEGRLYKGKKGEEKRIRWVGTVNVKRVNFSLFSKEHLSCKKILISVQEELLIAIASHLKFH